MIHQVAAFDGNGLRPYPVAHLRSHTTCGDTTATWIRRTRIDGDNWQSLEVPLGEASESYHIRILQAGLTLRESTVTSPQFTYTASQRMADGVTGPCEIAVAQVSQTYGPGPFRKVTA